MPRSGGASPLGGVDARGNDRRSPKFLLAWLICAAKRKCASTIGVLSDDEGFDYSGDLLLLASRKF